VVLEERQQVVGEVVPVAAGGVLLDLQPLGREPIRRKLMEGWIDGLLRPRAPARACARGLLAVGRRLWPCIGHTAGVRTGLGPEARPGGQRTYRGGAGQPSRVSFGGGAGSETATAPGRGSAAGRSTSFKPTRLSGAAVRSASMPHSGHAIRVAGDANRMQQRRQQRWVMMNARSRRDGCRGMLDEG
jgi:hypothetical protein